MLDPLVIGAIVALLQAIATVYFPEFALTEETFRAVVYVVLGWLGLEAGAKPLARAFMPKLIERGFLSKER